MWSDGLHLFCEIAIVNSLTEGIDDARNQERSQSGI